MCWYAAAIVDRSLTWLLHSHDYHLLAKRDYKRKNECVDVLLLLLGYSARKKNIYEQNAFSRSPKQPKPNRNSQAKNENIRKKKNNMKVVQCVRCEYLQSAICTAHGIEERKKDGRTPQALARQFIIAV